jgi:hypothetical protein
MLGPVNTATNQSGLLPPRVTGRAPAPIEVSGVRDVHSIHGWPLASEAPHFRLGNKIAGRDSLAF